MKNDNYSGAGKLLSALDHIEEGIQVIGFDWKYIYVNNAMAAHGKYPKEELIGSSVLDKYPGIEQTEVYQVYLRCFNERVSIKMENRFVFPDQSVGWFELSFQPVPDGLIILSKDITERKKNEEGIRQMNDELGQRVIESNARLDINIQQLKENEEKFQKAFQASAAGISITRLSDAVFVDVNAAFENMIGYSYEEIIGHTSVELGFIVDIEFREAILARIKKDGRAENFEMSIRNKAGKVIEILSSVETIMLSGEGYAINIIYDITQRKRAEEQLATANRELEAFSYTVSHDLKAPLRIVNNFAKMLEYKYAGVFDDDGTRILGVIQKNTRKMGNLIDALLEFSKLGEQVITREQIDLNTLMEDVMVDFNKGAKHHAEIRIGKLDQTLGDYTLLKQVVINLISNAVKYSSKVEHPVIEVSSKKNNNEVVFSVKDNGDGFDMRYAGKLFTVFSRLHSAEDFEGSGIGLATIKNIVTKHGGKVWAEGEPGKGATFSFSLPMI